MKEELKQYDANLRGDKVLLKKIFYMSLGIQAEKIAKQKKNDPNSNDKPNDANNIMGRRIVPDDNKGSAQGLDNDGNRGNGSKDLSDDEKTIAKSMGITEADYAKAKTTKIVSQLKGAAK
jgi:hypothetical protein